MPFTDKFLWQLERSTIPEAAVVPALTPSLFSKAYAILIFESLFSSSSTRKISLFLHLMTSFIWVVRAFSELFILVNCITSGERTNSRSSILLHGVYLQLNSKEDGFTGIKPGVVIDVSEVPVWPGESFYCGSVLCSHPFYTVFAWEGKSPAWLVEAGLGICGETLQCLYMGHYIWKSWCYCSL